MNTYCVLGWVQRLCISTESHFLEEAGRELVTKIVFNMTRRDGAHLYPQPL